MVYFDSIWTAFIVCPFLAAFLSFFFICFQYKKYGAISFYRCFVVYIFMLFCVSAYFLVILPLQAPHIVEKRTGNTVQLVPFEAVRAFFCDSGFSILHPSTYLRSLKRPEFYQPLFNLFLLFPLGCFLRYLFRCNKKKAWIISIATTLFFEITQFSGLYGLYLRPYRLFDVDDIILNSTGSMLGYFVTARIERFLPKWSKVNSKVYKRGQNVNVKRRYVADLIDSIMINIFSYLTMGFLFFGRLIRIILDDNYTQSERTTTKYYLIWFMVVWTTVGILYYIYHIERHNGITFGKKMVGIGLRMRDGSKPTRRKLYLRYAFKVVPSILASICMPSSFFLFRVENSDRIVLVAYLIVFMLFCDFVYTFFSHRKKYKRFYYERITDVVDYNIVIETQLKEIDELASVEEVVDNKKEVFGKITENTLAKVSEKTVKKNIEKNVQKTIEKNIEKNTEKTIEKTVEKNIEKNLSEATNKAKDSSKTDIKQVVEQN